MTGFLPESLRSCPPALILTAHGSVDPRSSATTFALADEVRRLRPGLDVRVAFCEHSEPNLRDALGGLRGPGVVTPLLLASAYHARVDIPAMIAEANADALQAEALGEDPRVIRVLGQRLDELGGPRDDTGVLVVAVGSSHPAANAATATLAGTLPGDWAAVQVAFATGPATAEPSVTDGIARMRALGVRRVVLAPWFIAPGRITDRVATIAAAEGVAMAEPLGAHPLLAATILDRFDGATATRLAA